MNDRRVRLRPKDAAATYVYGDLNRSQPSILSILRTTNGMVWNYTPTIRESRQVNYESQQPVHTNSGYNNYRNTNNTTLSVQGEFYAGTGSEAMYLLACITFLRSVTLMDFGRQAEQYHNPDFGVLGAPPPILLFSAYGRYMYNDIPVVVKSVSFDFAEDVDMVLVPLTTQGTTAVSANSTIGGLASNIKTYSNFQTVKQTAINSVQSKISASNALNVNVFNTKTSDINAFYNSIRVNGIQNQENMVYVPQKMSISLQLEQQPTPDFMSKKFNLNAYKRGDLLRKGGFI